MSFKENSKIYYGLDIGTDSVGWSTTNEKYELLRYKNNLMWGVSLFEAASLAEDAGVTERKDEDMTADSKEWHCSVNCLQKRF